jgi:circadian clock protein KaiB
LERALNNQLQLTLYISGHPERVKRIQESVTGLLDHLLAQPYRLQVIDVLDHPDLADQAEILVTPTLLVTIEGTERRFVGDMSDLSPLQLVIQGAQQRDADSPSAQASPARRET